MADAREGGTDRVVLLGPAQGGRQVKAGAPSRVHPAARHCLRFWCRHGPLGLGDPEPTWSWPPPRAPSLTAHLTGRADKRRHRPAADSHAISGW